MPTGEARSLGYGTSQGYSGSSLGYNANNNN